MKICNKCKIEKDLSEFHKNKYNKDGLEYLCKKCRIVKQNRKKYLVSRIYISQKCNSKDRGYPLPTYTKNELKEWLYSQPKFHKLYDNWKRLDYQKDYVPSVDRIDDYLSYTMANIQLMTWKENNIKGYNDRRKGINNKDNKAVIQYDMNEKKIAEYWSISEAARQINGDKGNIQKCCKNRAKTAGGFIWKYK